MDIQGADGFEAHAAPPGVKGAGAHVICAGHHGGGQQERVFQRNAAQVGLQPLLVLRRGRFRLRLHLVIQHVHQVPHGHLSRAHAFALARGRAGQAGIVFGQGKGSALFILEPDAAQQPGRLQGRAGFVAGRVVAERALDHIGTSDPGIGFKHGIPPFVFSPDGIGGLWFRTVWICFLPVFFQTLP